MAAISIGFRIPRLYVSLDDKSSTKNRTDHKLKAVNGFDDWSNPSAFYLCLELISANAGTRDQ